MIEGVSEEDLAFLAHRAVAAEGAGEAEDLVSAGMRSRRGVNADDVDRQGKVKLVIGRGELGPGVDRLKGKPLVGGAVVGNHTFDGQGASVRCVFVGVGQVLVETFPFGEGAGTAARLPFREMEAAEDVDGPVSQGRWDDEGGGTDPEERGALGLSGAGAELLGSSIISVSEASQEEGVLAGLLRRVARGVRRDRIGRQVDEAAVGGGGL